MKSNDQEITTFSGAHLPQPNRHQEIWSILENVWITIYQNRYYISKNFRILGFSFITVIHCTVSGLDCDFNVLDYLIENLLSNWYLRNSDAYLESLKNMYAWAVFIEICIQ